MTGESAQGLPYQSRGACSAAPGADRYRASPPDTARRQTRPAHRHSTPPTPPVGYWAMSTPGLSASAPSRKWAHAGDPWSNCSRRPGGGAYESGGGDLAPFVRSGGRVGRCRFPGRCWRARRGGSPRRCSLLGRCWRARRRRLPRRCSLLGRCWCARRGGSPRRSSLLGRCRFPGRARPVRRRTALNRRLHVLQLAHRPGGTPQRPPPPATVRRNEAQEEDDRLAGHEQ
jgi:hypothetical protein